MFKRIVSKLSGVRPLPVPVRQIPVVCEPMEARLCMSGDMLADGTSNTMMAIKDGTSNTLMIGEALPRPEAGRYHFTDAWPA